MRIIVIGLGVQGKKRSYFSKQDLVATVDPFNPKANFKDIKDVLLTDYDAAIVCTPDEKKLDILKYLLKNRKHVLIEKPLKLGSNEEIKSIEKIANKNKLVCYTAYNHRFEPHFVKLKERLDI